MLEELHKKFIDYYLQTGSGEEAARKAGIPNTEALSASIDMLSNPEIVEALRIRAKEYEEAVTALPLTKERLISIMMLQYEKANRLSKTKEAVDILARIAEIQGLKLDDIKVEPVQFIIHNLDENKI